MKYNHFFKIVVVLLAFAAMPQICQALTHDYFASKSKLSSGKWVKVWISEDGVYELTDSELKGMGFTDPEKVKVFGHGGVMQPETFGRAFIDDLSQVPTMIVAGKTIFYGRGVVEMSAKSSGSTLPYYTGKVNIYATQGCYFLTDNDQYTNLALSQVSTTELGTNNIKLSYDYYYHNKELKSWARSGKTFLGESMRDTGKLNFTFDVPNIVQDTTLMLSVAVAADVDASSTVSARINGTETSFNSGTNQIDPVDGQIIYNYCSPTGTIRTSFPDEKANLEIQLQDNGISDASLDYFVLTYLHKNLIPADSAQVRMGIYKPQSTDAVIVPNDNGDLHVWNVSTPQIPVEYNLAVKGEIRGFNPGTGTTWGQYVMFDASRQLKKVISSEPVANQNLHALPATNMIIITDKALAEQAERIAQVHRDVDGMSVVVVDQEDIFNEFSSGKPDCMAYRSFAKMIYDRNSAITKYLLLFGTGSYDNRGIGGKKSDYQLLTYQSDNSNSEVASFVTDDYFGFMDDASGSIIPSDYLRLNIGRIPVGTQEEAKVVADKIINYVKNDDSGEWHGKTLVIADEGDENMHMYQAEGACMTIDAETDSAMYIDKVYVPWFALNVNNEAVTARQRIADSQKEGVLLASYIGHANYTFFTNYRKLWRSTDAANLMLPHVPFFSIAACNTARFDSDERGIVEEMILNPKGGSIGVMASARTVYSTQNDKLNVAFIKSMITPTNNGYTTLGEAFKSAKMIFSSEYNVNKMSFILFGDPAVKVRCPKELCKITEIDGKLVGKDVISVKPMTSFKVKGVVNNSDGTLNRGFNGEVTVTLYDKRELYASLKDRYSTSAPLRDSYYPRERLCENKATVVNGVYEVDLIAPKDCKAQGDSCLIRVFAKNASGEMVMGRTDSFKLVPFDSSLTLEDTEKPKIVKLQIGEGTDGYVNSNTNAYIEAIDNVGIDIRSFSMTNGMKVIIDGGKKTITSVPDYFNLSNGGKKAVGVIGLENLTPGRHTIEYTVNDLAGNQSSRLEEFFVGGGILDGELELEKDAIRNSAMFNLSVPDQILTSVRYYILDATGNTILVKDTTDIKWTWDLKDAQGARVNPGKYACYATFGNSEESGITKEVKFVVLGE